MKPLFVFMIFFAKEEGLQRLNLTRQLSILAQDKSITEFVFSEVTFDEFGKMPTPPIPKGWRFVGVSNGEKLNCNFN